MAYMKAGWATIRTSQTVEEVLPSHDVIEHKNQFTCPCNPTIRSEVYGDTVYWSIIHNSFDEYLDETDTEPYKGL